MMLKAVPCTGSMHLLFPSVEQEVVGLDGQIVLVDVEDPDAEAPAFCVTCPESLACLQRGWLDEDGIWGSFTSVQRAEARSNKQTPEELWSTKFQ